MAADLPTLDLPRGDYAWSVDLGDFFEYVEFTVAEGGV